MGGEDWDPWEADYGDDLQAMMDMENPEVHDRDSHNEDSTIQNFEITTDDAQPVLPNNDFPNQYAHQQLLHGVARSMFSGKKSRSTSLATGFSRLNQRALREENESAGGVSIIGAAYAEDTQNTGFSLGEDSLDEYRATLHGQGSIFSEMDWSNDLDRQSVDDDNEESVESMQGRPGTTSALQSRGLDNLMETSPASMEIDDEIRQALGQGLFSKTAKLVSAPAHSEPRKRPLPADSATGGPQKRRAMTGGAFYMSDSDSEEEETGHMPSFGKRTDPPALQPSRQRGPFGDSDDDAPPLQYPDSDSDNPAASEPIQPAPKRPKINNNRTTIPAMELSPPLQAPSSLASSFPRKKKSSRAAGLLLPTRNYTVLPRDTNRFRLASNSAGTKLYFPLKRKTISESAGMMSKVMADKTKLLGTSIYAMMETIEAERTRAAKDESAKEFLREEYKKMGEQVPSFDVDEDDSLDGKLRPSSSANQSKEKLWVDKYAPKMYIDLVGDERVNRQVLAWVKEWDYCVFKRSRKQKYSAMTGKSYAGMHMERDHLQRPPKKVLLLTGPPGLGKTTLAHVIARQAGYHVVEINASDDRTGDSIKNRLVGALETQSVLGSRKPHLVVIDEIDGASASGQGEHNFIKLLTDFIKGDSNPERDVESGNSKKANKRRPLVRPIICICNDPYAPVLRPLRLLAEILNFRAPPIKVLAKRLHEICRWEGLQTDLRTLTALCELTEGDIRSSLNTLQFLKKKCKVLTVDVLSSLDVGQKDVGRGLFVVWEELFRVPGQKRKTISGMGHKAQPGTDQENRYIQRLHSLIASNGEYDKIVQGCFENYLSSKIFDTVSASAAPGGAAPTKVEQALDWLSFYDRVHYRVRMRHMFEVAGYLPYVGVNFHRLFASAARIRLEFPRADATLAINKAKNRNILTNLLTAMPPISRRTWSDVEMIMLELVSYLLRIISPEMRPVNIQLLKPFEREMLTRLIDVMVSLGLRFRQEKNEEGHYVFLLDPPIDALLQSLSSGLDPAKSSLSVTCSSKRVLGGPYAVKQMVSLQVEREIIRRADAAATERITITQGQQRKTANNTVVTALNKPAKPQIVTNLAAKQVNGTKPQRDFFGRILSDTVSQVHDLEDANHIKSHGIKHQKEHAAKVTFKFNEGFSNAVRKVVLVKDFM